MRVYVCARIGKPGQTERVEFLAKELLNAGFSVTSCLDRPGYVEKDWREDFEEAHQQLANLEKFFFEKRFDVVVADLSAASDGRTNEQILARESGIPVYGFAPVAIPTPWRLVQVDEVFRDTEQLISALIKLSKELILEKETAKEKERLRNRNVLYQLWGKEWVNSTCLLVTALELFVLGILFLSFGRTGSFTLLSLISILVFGFLIYLAYQHRKVVR